MYSVIATDLDETLLHSDHTLDPFTADTVARRRGARRAGIIAMSRASAICWASTPI